ncbi:MAG TPA: phosphoribosylglycinamide synthetase C domain-containing protein, partial [Acidimicrobiales bacterium]|nr:phosphoribosylglycinamide synthetase C domain-containing protein [Acidimicrobiales bacterium]
AEAAGATVFCAGVAADPDGAPGDLVTAGGRVLGVTATGPSVAAARNQAYAAAGQITWRGMYHRTDIALEAANT